MRWQAKYIVWCTVVLIIAGAAAFYAVHRSGKGMAHVRVAAPHEKRGATIAISASARAARSVAAPARMASEIELNPSKLAFGPASSADLMRFVTAFEGELRRYDPRAAGDIPIFHAAFYGNTAELSAYLDGGGNPNLTAQFSEVNNRESLLVAAISAGQRGVIRELIARGANVNLNPDGTNNTPLVTAAADGEQDVVRELLSHGANIEQMDGNGNTAMGAAVLGGNYSTVRLLLDSGASIGRALTPDGRVPPYVANSTKPNLVAIKKLLIARGARAGDPGSAGAGG